MTRQQKLDRIREIDEELEVIRAGQRKLSEDHAALIAELAELARQVTGEYA